ncbi:MAG: flagellar biosynthesis anti-sigma factor FlgM [Planctomycetota bacterium]
MSTSVDKTSGINQNLAGGIAGNQNLARPEKTNKAASGIFRELHTPGEEYKVEISVEAEELQKTLSTLKAEINKLPDIREVKIKNARARIEGGIYDRDAVVKEVARSIKESGLI